MVKTSVIERRRLVSIMKCEREQGLDEIKKELEAEKNQLIEADTSAIKIIQDKIDDLVAVRQAHEKNIQNALSDTQLDHIYNSCGDVPEKLRTYKQETNQIERKILLGDTTWWSEDI